MEILSLAGDADAFKRERCADRLELASQRGQSKQIASFCRIESKSLFQKKQEFARSIGNKFTTDTIVPHNTFIVGWSRFCTFAVPPTINYICRVTSNHVGINLHHDASSHPAQSASTVVDWRVSQLHLRKSYCASLYPIIYIPLHSSHNRVVALRALLPLCMQPAPRPVSRVFWHPSVLVRSSSEPSAQSFFDLGWIWCSSFVLR